MLFGVGFNHLHYLDKELQTDFSGRRALRSFVGIVVDELSLIHIYGWSERMVQRLF